MSTSVSLSDRIKAEFAAVQQRQQATQQEKEKKAQEQDQAIATFDKTCEQLKAIWQPKIQDFAKQFGDGIKVTPSITPSLREAKMTFLTDMATVSLTISVALSPDLSKLVCEYDLFIVPIFFQYERNARFETSVSKPDTAALGAWLDDRLVDCVKVYLNMQENEIYIKRSMVEDPITKTKLRREDAKEKLEHDGQTFYFTSKETFDDFKKKHLLSAEAPAKSTEAKPAAGTPQQPPSKA